ncbi:MAG: hypothetical protein QOG17_935 [Gammaproteobacteria bacterium]|jgi:hypothetical protein|nr:hypothetical protein [Gammaproteobacteria bacterium]
MSWYNIEVTPLPNWEGPLWHYLVPAASPADALATLQQARDIPKAAKMRVVPRF